MNILVIESSPHKHGSSNLLADSFIRGSEEAGHAVTVFDAGHAMVHPCLGCEVCGMSGPCCQKDDMETVRELPLQTDMAVFVTPLYYFNLSAQLKAVIDRFYSFTGKLSAKKLKTSLVVAAWDENDWTMSAVRAYYETLCRYMHFENQGMILGTGCGTAPMTKSTEFPRLAYELGKKIGG